MMSNRSIEILFGKATNPANRLDDVATYQAVHEFWVAVSEQLDGHLVALRLITHKMQSPIEQEALLSLMALQACAKNCSKMHTEIGRFRFLNEMVKLVSPKYKGGQTGAKVKENILHLIYTWTKEIPHEPKIKEAYEMLKRQGIVKKDTECLLNDCPMITDGAPSPPRMATFEDEEKARQLKKLLSSKNPQDLQAANRMIKTMVKDEERRTENVTNRMGKMEAVKTNMKLLNEMLTEFVHGRSGEGEREVMKDLYDSCTTLRASLFRLASATDDSDEGLRDLLQATDDIGGVMNRYEAVVHRGEVDTANHSGEKSLMELDNPEGASGLLNEELAALGLAEPIAASKPIKNHINLSTDLLHHSPSDEATNNRSKALEDLDLLGESLLRQHLPPDKPLVAALNRAQAVKVPMNQMLKPSLEAPLIDVADVSTDKVRPMDSPTLTDDRESVGSHDTSLLDAESTLIEDVVPVQPQSLTDVTISLQDVKPSIHAPLQILDTAKLSVVLHFGDSGCRPRDDVSVMVVITTSKHEQPISNLVFQVVVPKSMKCKLLAPSSDSLPAYNQFLPPPSISQVLLVANPRKESTTLKYVLCYTVDDDLVTEQGETATLPVY